MNFPNTMLEAIGIELLESEKGTLKGKMPVDHRTKQPLGFLHGGASVALAETLASIGSANMVDIKKYNVFGVDINATHIKSIREGEVFGMATAIKVGSRIHVWNIDITNKEGDLLSVARCTVMISERR